MVEKLAVTVWRKKSGSMERKSQQILPDPIQKKHRVVHYKAMSFPEVGEIRCAHASIRWRRGPCLELYYLVVPRTNEAIRQSRRHLISTMQRRDAVRLSRHEAKQGSIDAISLCSSAWIS